MKKEKLTKKPMALAVFLSALFLIILTVSFGLMTRLSPFPPFKDLKTVESEEEAKATAAEKNLPGKKFFPGEKIPGEDYPGDKSPWESFLWEDFPWRGWRYMPDEDLFGDKEEKEPEKEKKLPEKETPDKDTDKDNDKEKEGEREKSPREMTLIEEAADHRARELFNLGDEYEVYEIYIRDAIADLRYQSEKEEINVGLNMEDNLVFNFNRYPKEEEKEEDKEEELSEEELEKARERAGEMAREQLKQLYPRQVEEDILATSYYRIEPLHDGVKKDRGAGDEGAAGEVKRTYEVFFPRHKNGITVGNDGVDLTVEVSPDAPKGELTRVDKDFTRVDEFRSFDVADKDLEEAREKMLERFPLQLIYDLEKKSYYYTFLGEMKAASAISDLSLNYYIDPDSKEFFNWNFVNLEEDNIEDVLTDRGKIKDSYLGELVVELEGEQLMDSPWGEVEKEEVEKEYVEKVIKKALQASGYPEGFEIADIEVVPELSSPPPALEGQEMYKASLKHEKIEDDPEGASSAYVCRETGELIKLSIDPHLLMQLEPYVDSSIASELEGLSIGDLEKAILSNFPVQEEQRLLPRNEVSELFIKDKEAGTLEREDIKASNGGLTGAGRANPNFNFVLVEDGVPISGSGFYIVIDEYTNVPWEIIRVPPQLIEKDIEQVRNTSPHIDLEKARERLIEELDVVLSYELEPGGMYPGEDSIMSPVYQLKHLRYRGLLTPEVPYVDALEGEVYTSAGDSYRRDNVGELAMLEAVVPGQAPWKLSHKSPLS